MVFEEFVDSHVAMIQPLERKSALAYWQATLSGRAEDFEHYGRLQLELEHIYTNPDEYGFVKRIRESGSFGDGEQRRMAELLYRRYQGNQVDPGLLERIVTLGTEIENAFSVFRAVVDGKELTTNEVHCILRNEKDVSVRRKTWEASKKVGEVVASDLKELVRLRNIAARQIGFDNFYTMSLTLGEIDEGELERVFAELDGLTSAPFFALKRGLDGTITRRFGIGGGEIMPWHYHDPFLQEAPPSDEIDADTFYRERDVVGIARDFYQSIGLPVDDILERSDLYEKDGKYPHAYCTDIDRLGDIRILANCKDNNHWMETILHELGHGVYDKNVDSSLPYLLRKYPHLCATEASAMYFGRLAQDPSWMADALGLDKNEIAGFASEITGLLRQKQLVFSRWCQTMFHFERGLYRDPEQDLNGLWWQIVERYQGVRRPEGRDACDWATKIHIISSPVYYHNYLLGEMIASQFHSHMATRVLGLPDGEIDIYGNRKVGAYFREAVFRPGNIHPWGAHIERATGEPLKAKHFVRQFVKESG